MRRILIALLLVSMVHIVYSQDISNKQNKNQNAFQEISELVKKRSFVFEADKTFKQGGGMVDLTANPNYLKIENNQVKADLPFFGETHMITDMDDAGINFEGEMLDYKETYHDEKMKISISFDVNSMHDKYSCTLDIFYSGNTTLNIDCTSKSHTRYIGKIEPINP